MSGLLFACLPSLLSHELMLQQAHPSSPVSEHFSVFGYMAPPGAPLSVFLEKHPPVSPHVFKKDDKEEV